MNTKEIILNCLGERLETLFTGIQDDFFMQVEELRFRAGQPIIMIQKGTEYTITNQKEISKNINMGCLVGQADILTVLELTSGRSMYAFSEDIKNGFMTINGGHRIGVAGKVVTSPDGIKTIKNFNSLNIRISHQIIGCADSIMGHITKNKREVFHTMIISPPGCGKTTLLRDMIRQISNGIQDLIIGQTVGIVDERSEIAGCYMGVPQNDIGIRTDVLDGCKKAEGMLMLLRAMSPKVIAVDEIGKHEDVHAIDDIINAGVTIICTVHGKSLEDIRKKPVLSEIIEKGIFKRFIVLKKPGEVEGVYDENFSRQNHLEKSKFGFAHGMCTVSNSYSKLERAEGGVC
ncbi:MAG: stage III sporulation protein AA [Defluviitaleaceae bacterium]|nr:stage III sporulation protein AA [Defluviitaleaceae bacterium]